MLCRLAVLATCFLGLSSAPTLADEPPLYEPVLDLTLKAGNHRSLAVADALFPLAQDRNRVLFANLRSVLSDQSTWEGNAGVGYRTIVGHRAIVGGYAYFDRRISENDTTFQQVTAGLEVIGEDWGGRVNLYRPVGRDRKTVQVTAPTASISGSRILVDDGRITETSLQGFDAEIGHRLPLPADMRLYAGLYHFSGEGVTDVDGYRLRFDSGLSESIRIGAEYSFADDTRGNEIFATVKFRFPVPEQNQEEQKTPLQKRMLEPVVRDIDVVTAAVKSDPVPALRPDGSGEARILFVDNQASPGGDGTAGQPFSTLAEAEAAAERWDTIFILGGDGTSAGMNTGITLAEEGLQLAGAGVPLRLDPARVRLPETVAPAAVGGTKLVPEGTAPIITNSAGDGITVEADHIRIAGLTVSGASGDGITIKASGAGESRTGTDIENVSLTGNNHGISVTASNGASASVRVQCTTATGNRSHGIVIHDDTDGAFTVDLGGGNLGSIGKNRLFGNTLEEVAVDLDGGTLSAMNNWWGQPGEPPSSRIYLGTPLVENLAGFWRLDENSGTQTSDYSGGGATGSFNNDPEWAVGRFGAALDFERDDSDSVQIPEPAGSDGSQALSVSFWIRPETTAALATHISKWSPANAGTDNAWGIRATNGDGTELYFFIANGDDAGNNYFTTSDADLAPGTWSHLAFVFDGSASNNGGRLRVYKNGALMNGAFTGTIPATLNDTAEPVRIGHPLIGNPAFADYYDGLVDDVRIYSSALSADDIQSLYNLDASSVISSADALSEDPGN